MDFNDPSFRELLDALHDGVYITDADGITLKVNGAYERLTGLRSEDVVGQHMQALVEQGVISQSVSLRVLKEGKALSLMQSVSQGKRLLVSGTPILDAAGHVRYVVSTVRDMTELLRIKHERDELQQLKQLRNSTAKLHAGQRDDLLDASPVANHPASGRLFGQARQVAASDVKVLLQGETGVGKTLIAQYIHKRSPRAAQPFLALNCGALPENLIEAELFGYVAGAFTGAGSKGKRGLLELAHHGTVFLDEIGEMSPYLQAKLLRFLSDGTFRRVGGDREERVNVRIISATHRDLERMVTEGEFREDLFYRLNVLNLQVPPLRERGQDIVLLARHFMQQACAQIQRTQCRLTPDTYPALLGNRWPGNVRQLQNVIFRAAAICESNLVQVGDLDIAGTAVAQQQAGGEVTSLEAAVSAFEKELLETYYASHPSTRQLAARLQTSHSAIATRLRKYGIKANR